MSRLAFPLLLASIGLLSCTRQPTPEPQASPVRTAALAKRADQTLRCQLAYYPLGAETESDPPQQPQRTVLTVAGDSQGEVTLAGLRLYASYVIGQSHHSGVKLELSAEGGLLLGQLYQLPDSTPPSDLGGGFTGAVSLRRPGQAGDYQYSCELLPDAPSP